MMNVISAGEELFGLVYLEESNTRTFSLSNGQLNERFEFWLVCFIWSHDAIQQYDVHVFGQYNQTHDYHNYQVEMHFSSIHTNIEITPLICSCYETQLPAKNTLLPDLVYTYLF